MVPMVRDLVIETVHGVRHQVPADVFDRGQQPPLVSRTDIEGREEDECSQETKTERVAKR